MKNNQTEDDYLNDIDLDDIQLLNRILSNKKAVKL